MCDFGVSNPGLQKSQRVKRTALEGALPRHWVSQHVLAIRVMWLQNLLQCLTVAVIELGTCDHGRQPMVQTHFLEFKECNKASLVVVACQGSFGDVIIGNQASDHPIIEALHNKVSALCSCFGHQNMQLHQRIETTFAAILFFKMQQR